MRSAPLVIVRRDISTAFSTRAPGESESSRTQRIKIRKVPAGEIPYLRILRHNSGRRT
jgi:hypothetical protein